VAITGGAVVAPSGDAVPTASLSAEWRERVGRVERISALALTAGVRALAQAGLAVGPRREDAGIVLGTAFGCFLTNADFQRRVAAGGPSAASPRSFAATVSNAAAGELAIALGFAGPGITLSAAGASATAALGHAAALIGRGAAAVLLAGGVDAAGPALQSFIDAGALALGAPVREAAALAVLEDAWQARRRGARVHGLLVGHGMGFEPHAAAAAAGRGLVRAIVQAAGGARGEVVAVASAASPVMRAVAERAVTEALGRSVRQLAFEDGMGHALGASGAEALLRVLETEPSRGIVLIIDACASGHVAALAVRAGDAA
jgi:3-oxoacyl-(acyl-carrier-protein) synthase